MDQKKFNNFLEQESKEINDLLHSVWTDSDLKCLGTLRKIASNQNSSITFHGYVHAVISHDYVTTNFKNGKQITLTISDFKKIMFPKE